MATKPTGAPSPLSSSQPFFVVCGPSPKVRQKLLKLRKFLRQHLGLLLTITALGLSSFGRWWTLKDCPGLDGLTFWGGEILAGVFLLLVIQLYRTFRHWGQESMMRARAKREHNEELGALYCTPPSLEEAEDNFSSPREIFALSIEQWTSHPTTQLCEDYLQRVQLPDEVLAPDVLVLQIERKEAG